jgi:hypothetical protein
MTERSSLIGHEMLQAWPDEDIQRLVVLLNDAGVATDEDELRLGPMLIKVWTDECERLLRRHGYAGGTLGRFGWHDRDAGTLLCIFDLDRLKADVLIALLQRGIAPHRSIDRL